MFVAIDHFLGYAYPSIPKEAELLNYMVVRDPHTNEKKIEVWTYLRDENRTRLYLFDYTPENDERFHRGMEIVGEGGMIMLREHGGNPGAFELHDIPHVRLPSKD